MGIALSERLPQQQLDKLKNIKKQEQSKLMDLQTSKEGFILRKGDKVKSETGNFEGTIIQVYRKIGEAKVENDLGKKRIVPLNQLEINTKIKKEIKENEINQLFDLILENSSTDEKIQKNTEFIKTSQEMNVSWEELDSLIVYLNLQKGAEKAFKKMNQYKKFVKKFEQEKYDKLKNEWNLCKDNLVKFQPDEELLKLSPQEITEKTKGNNVQKIIRKLNLGVLSGNQREGLLDALQEGLDKLKGKEKKERQAA